MASFVERAGFDLSLRYPEFFRRIVRPELYRKYGPDPEDVHEAVLRRLPEFSDVLERHKPDFPELEVEIKDIRMLPFGTAAGLDKNGDAHNYLAKIFGFLEDGTVVVPIREGNRRPRVAVDERRLDAYNAQGFPSKGREYFLTKLDGYTGDTPLFVNICGLPAEGNFDKAYEETDQLATDMSRYRKVNGIVWNPFSPNTSSLVQLRTPESFRRHAEIIRKKIGSRLLLVKKGPYENEDTKKSLELDAAFLEGGGDGVVTTNTYMVPKDKVPSDLWGYTSAGRSGKFLRYYRMRSIRDVRQAFGNEVIIFATGGIFDANDAYETFAAGANAIEGYTPYTFYGLGLARQLMKGVRQRLWRDGYPTFEAMKLDLPKIKC